MTDICAKLKEYFTFKGLNLSDVERDCGFSKNTLRKSFDRGSTIGSDKLMVIMKTYPDMSAEWLLRDEGQMERSNQNISDVHNSKLYGVNVNGKDIHVDCPFRGENDNPLVEFIRNYQNSVNAFQHQINDLLIMMKYEQSKH